MEPLLLITYIVSIALSAMVLGLAITFRVFHKAHWCSWYIVLQSCLFGTIILGCLNLIAHALFGPVAAVVFPYIFKIMMHATMGVICFLIPYFLKWILSTTWTKLHFVLCMLASIVYFAIGLVSVLTNKEGVALIVQAAIVLAIYSYSVLAIWINLKRVASQESRRVCLAFNITSLCMIPLAVLSFIFDSVREFSYPSYVIVFSIVMLVYFYVRFNLDSKRNSSGGMASKTFENFKVTDREYAVIKLVCDGLTNKEIASELNISVNTVNNHVANIFEKVGARSRVDLLNMMKSNPWD